jgi:ATPase subunit of ABC transporter with duplicated ATPase domains
VLEAALDEFVGTVLVISHDRYFSIAWHASSRLQDGALHEYVGGSHTSKAARLIYHRDADARSSLQ